MFSNKKLAKLLEDPRIRLSGIAKAAGISVQSLYAIRDGKYVPGANTLWGLALALDKDISYFFDNKCKYSYIKDDKNEETA